MVNSPGVIQNGALRRQVVRVVSTEINRLKGTNAHGKNVKLSATIRADYSCQRRNYCGGGNCRNLADIVLDLPSNSHGPFD